MWQRVELKTADGTEFVEARPWQAGMPEGDEYPSKGQVLIRAAGETGDAATDDRTVVNSLSLEEFEAALA